MRISPNHREFFKNYWSNILPDSKIFLFGSRADDNKKGGDIDLMILSNNKISLDQKLKFVSQFYVRFGEQKIDVTAFTFSEQTPFKKIALQNAIEL